MIKRLLIANRGEIAVRVIRACRELGIEAVAVYSQSDAESMAVDLADRAVCIGPAGPAARSYLDVHAVIAATQGTGCDAIHPGYGFLAENPDFVEQCEAAGLTFVGPRAASIRLMGDKVAARKTVSEAGVPVVPGSLEPIVDADEARTLAQEIGLPVMPVRPVAASQRRRSVFPVRQAQHPRHHLEGMPEQEPAAIAHVSFEMVEKFRTFSPPITALRSMLVPRIRPRLCQI